MRHLFVVAAAVVGVCMSAQAGWPQFLGSDRTGISRETVKLAKTWPTEGPKVLWTASVGPGFGGAAIDGNEVFLLDRENNKQDVLRCLGLAGGNELWRYAYDAPGALDHNGSRSTPAVDDKYVFTVGPFGQFLCVDRKTHKVLWQKDLLKDFGANKPNWAVAQSPLLYKDWVIVAPCGRTAGLVAFKKDSGEIAWKSESCGSQQYMSATPMKIEGVEQIVAYGNGGRKTTTVLSVDAASGQTLWKFDKWGCDLPIACPVHAGDGKVFLTGGYKAGSVMFQVKKKDSAWSAEELWRLGSRECGSQIHDPLVWDGHLFVDNNENGKNNGMVCVGLDGKVAWSSKNPNCNLGGQIIADGMIYKVDGAKGLLYLVEPSAESFKVVAQAKLLNPGEDWAPLAISDGKLIIRDQGQMKCLDVK
jgi:outer membrane protein assembly factor BamB